MTFSTRENTTVTALAYDKAVRKSMKTNNEGSICSIVTDGGSVFVVEVLDCHTIQLGQSAHN